MPRSRERGVRDPIEEAETRYNAIDPLTVERLMADEGLSWSEAVRVAGTTMNGVRQDPGGDVWGTQTYCDKLNPKGFKRRFRPRRRR